MKVNKKFVLVIQYLACLTILILAIRFFDFHTVWITIKTAEIHFVILAFSFGLLTLIISAVKLFVCLGFIAKVKFSSVLYAILNGKIFGYFAPGTIGADLSVILSLQSPKNSIFNIGSIVLIDRVLSLLSITLLMFILLPFSFNRMPVPIQHFVLIVLPTCSLCLTIAVVACICKQSFLKKILNNKLSSLSLNTLTKMPVLVIKKWWRSLIVVILGLILNACIQCGTYFLLHAVHLNVDLLYVMGVLPLNSFLVMVPVSIMGIGLREGGFYFLLSSFSITMEDVIAFNMIGYLFEIIIIMISGSTLLIKAITNLILKKV
jgi:uncharacterized membrane protein YbhN (UPF0104 family)